MSTEIVKIIIIIIIMNINEQTHEQTSRQITSQIIIIKIIIETYKYTFKDIRLQAQIQLLTHRLLMDTDLCVRMRCIIISQGHSMRLFKSRGRRRGLTFWRYKVGEM